MLSLDAKLDQRNWSVTILSFNSELVKSMMKTWSSLSLMAIKMNMLTSKELKIHRWKTAKTILQSNKALVLYPNLHRNKNKTDAKILNPRVLQVSTGKKKKSLKITSSLKKCLAMTISRYHLRISKSLQTWSKSLKTYPPEKDHHCN